MTDYCDQPNCPGCKIQQCLDDLIAEGFPEELVIGLVLLRLEETFDNISIKHTIHEEPEFGTVH